jgi:hypothetical protein
MTCCRSRYWLTDQFGRFLREDERVEFTRATAANDVVVYDNRVRKTLVLKSAAVYRTEEPFAGPCPN